MNNGDKLGKNAITVFAPLYQDLRRFTPTTRGRPLWFALLWQLVQSLLVALSPPPCHGWRRFWLRRFGAEIGRGVIVRSSVRVHFPWRLTIGDYSWIGDAVRLYSLGPIALGAHTVISQGAHLCAGTHDYHRIDFATLLAPVVIGNEVWIGADAFIGPGVTIGDGTIIGARCGVFKSVPGGKIYAGLPAHEIGTRVIPNNVADVN